MKRKLKNALSVTVKKTKISQSRPSETHTSQSEPAEAHGGKWEPWESDSGISSGQSSPVRGHVSPIGRGAQAQDSEDTGLDLTQTPVQPQTQLVSLDCEMVGTGPTGRVSEVARCSLVDYNGHVLFDKYIRPIGPVTDFRSQWSGIRKHHLTQATSFSHARDQVKSLLKGKVLVGHSVLVDLKSLDLLHPGHMIRDISTTRLLKRLARFPPEHRPSLKALTNRLLHRKIQVGRHGHCPLEDARAALDLYKLVEGEWEREVELSLRDERDPSPPSYASSRHYMNDEYWPTHF